MLKKEDNQRVHKKLGNWKKEESKEEIDDEEEFKRFKSSSMGVFKNQYSSKPKSISRNLVSR